MNAEQRTLGSLHLWSGVPVVRLEDTYATDVDDLWDAITNPDRLSRWVAQVTGELNLGGRFFARFSSGAEGPGRVDECEPPRRLRLTMEPGEDTSTTIEATLADVDGGTRLVIIERGLPESDLPSYGSGWQVHLEDLRAHLGNAPTADWQARAADLLPSYAAMSVQRH